MLIKDKIFSMQICSNECEKRYRVHALKSEFRQYFINDINDFSIIYPDKKLSCGLA